MLDYIVYTHQFKYCILRVHTTFLPVALEGAKADLPGVIHILSSYTNVRLKIQGKL